MKVRLIDVDGNGHHKKWGATVFPNLALAKIANYHKNHGNDVDWYDSSCQEEYDIVYMSKVFNFSPDYPYAVKAKKIVRGGTGYDIHSCLPQDIDDMQPDLTIYKEVPQDVSYGFLTRGCPNRCPWCVVPAKEGLIRPYWDVERVANGKKKLILMDNNILAAGEYAMEQLDKIIEKRYHVEFNQAIDARLVNEAYAEKLAKIRWLHSRIGFGCDTVAQIAQCERAIELIARYGYRGEFYLYTMINDNFIESYKRINHWRERLLKVRKTHKGNATYPYAQPFRDPMNSSHSVPKWQKDLAAWCNKRMIFFVTPFEDYQPRKGFKCSEYFKQFYK